MLVIQVAGTSPVTSAQHTKSLMLCKKVDNKKKIHFRDHKKLRNPPSGLHHSVPSLKYQSFTQEKRESTFRWLQKLVHLDPGLSLVLSG